MKNQFIGDISDFAKYVLLRELTKGKEIRLGVAWYLNPDDKTGYGDETEYLCEKHAARYYEQDPEVFNEMDAIIKGNKPRCVRTIQKSKLLGDDCCFVDRKLDNQNRKEWFRHTIASLRDCQIVFADPDNGLCETSDRDGKHITLDEVLRLANGSKSRMVVIYQFLGQGVGKPFDEHIECWREKLGSRTLAIRFRDFGSRAFYIVNPTCFAGKVLKSLEERWPRNTSGCGPKLYGVVDSVGSE